MFKKVTLITVLLAMLSGLSNAEAIACSDENTVDLSSADMSLTEKQNVLADAFLNYSSYCSSATTSCEICFLTPQEGLTVNKGFSIVVNVAQDVNFYGVRLVKAADKIFNEPLITVTNNGTSKVAIKDFKLSNVKNALLLSGTGPIEINNAIITGDANKSGACVDIQSPSAVVKSSDISSCNEGIRISSNGNLIGADLAANYESQKNLIHNNVTGIHVVGGTGNKFAYNSIFENKIGDTETSMQGILIDAGSNDGLVSPTLILADQDEKLGLTCERDSANRIISRYLSFEIPAKGQIDIYSTGLLGSVSAKQGKIYLTSCEVASDGICKILGLNGYEFAADKCGIENLFVTAIFTSTSSSMFLAEPFELNGIFSVPSPPPHDMPSPSGLMPESEEPGSITNDSKIDTEDETMGGGMDSMGSGMKCSLTENSSANGAGMMAVIMALCLVGLVALRKRSCE